MLNNYLVVQHESLRPNNTYKYFGDFYALYYANLCLDFNISSRQFSDRLKRVSNSFEEFFNNGEWVPQKKDNSSYVKFAPKLGIWKPKKNP